MQPFTRVVELWDWLLSLPPDFAFLLALPFLVAGAALLRGGVDRYCRSRCSKQP